MTMSTPLRSAVTAYAGAQGFSVESFQVTGVPNMRVLDVIRSIYENQAGDLAYQFACRVGRCGTCAMRVNGRPCAFRKTTPCPAVPANLGRVSRT